MIREWVSSEICNIEMYTPLNTPKKADIGIGKFMVIN